MTHFSSILLFLHTQAAKTHMTISNKIHCHLFANELHSAEIIVPLVFSVILITLIFLCYRLYKKSQFYQEEMRLIETRQQKELTEQNSLAREIANDYINILSNTALLESFLPEDERKYGLKILKKIYDAVYGKKNFPWEKAYKAISILYNNLPEKLRRQYPELDEAEIRICCLTYMEVNNTEIATIMRFKINTVQAKKSVIRKKLGIDGYGNIRDFIIEDLEKEGK